MAEQHKKADGTQTVNGDIPVVTPSNIGDGLVWIPGENKYKVDNTDLMERISTLEQVINDPVIKLFLQRKTMVGMLFPFFGKTIPEGYIIADGRRIDPITQPILHEIYGEFMPDTRGSFLRGLDEGKGLDPDRELGTLQQGSAVAFDPTFDAPWVTSLINTNSAIDSDPIQGYKNVGLDYLSDNDLRAKYPNIGIAYTSIDGYRRLGENMFRFGIVRPSNISCRYICLSG